MALTVRTLTGPLPGVTGGTMHARLTATLHNPAGVLAGAELGPQIDAAIGSGGTFSLVLYANDDAASATLGTAWRIWGELVTAVGIFQYAPELIQLSTTDPASVALGTLTPATASPAYYTYATQAALGTHAAETIAAGAHGGIAGLSTDVPTPGQRLTYAGGNAATWEAPSSGTVQTVAGVAPDTGGNVPLDGSNLTAYDPNSGENATLDTIILGIEVDASSNLQAFQFHTTLTTAAHGGIVASTDPALTNARIPVAHAASHISGTDLLPAAVAGGASGLLTGADKTKLDSVASGAQPGTVTAVTGTGNIASTGGTTPQLSVTGVLPVANGGTGAATAGANQGFFGPTTGSAAAPGFRAPVIADLPATVAVTNADNSFTAAQTTTVADAATTTATVTRTGRHTSSGIPAAGFGNAWLERAHNAANTLTDLWQIVGQWATATNGSESSDLLIQLRNAGAALATVLKIKGVGGFQAQSTNSGGTQPNAPGANAVDWQTYRTAATQTASQTYAAIGGGLQNTASGSGSEIGGGQANSASGLLAAIGGGQANNITAAHGFIGGGFTNTVSGQFGGIVGGIQAVANLYGQQAQAAGAFSTNGDAQTSQLVARLITTNATAGEIWLDGASVRLTLATGRAFAYSLLCIARDGTTPDVAAWTATGILYRQAGNVTLLGNTVTVISNAGGLTFAPAADTTNQSLQLAVAGLSGKTYHWVCRIVLTEVI